MEELCQREIYAFSHSIRVVGQTSDRDASSDHLGYAGINVVADNGTLRTRRGTIYVGEAPSGHNVPARYQSNTYVIGADKTLRLEDGVSLPRSNQNVQAAVEHAFTFNNQTWVIGDRIERVDVNGTIYPEPAGKVKPHQMNGKYAANLLKAPTALRFNATAVGTTIDINSNTFDLGPFDLTAGKFHSTATFNTAKPIVKVVLRGNSLAGISYMSARLNGNVYWIRNIGDTYEIFVSAGWDHVKSALEAAGASLVDSAGILNDYTNDPVLRSFGVDIIGLYAGWELSQDNTPQEAVIDENTNYLTEHVNGFQNSQLLPRAKLDTAMLVNGRWYTNSIVETADAVWALVPGQQSTASFIGNVGYFSANTTSTNIEWSGPGKTDLFTPADSSYNPILYGSKILQVGSYAGRTWVAHEKGISFSKAGEPNNFVETKIKADGTLTGNMDVWNDNDGLQLTPDSAFHIKLPMDLSVNKPITVLQDGLLIAGQEVYSLSAPNSLFTYATYRLAETNIDATGNIVSAGSKLFWLARSGDEYVIRYAARQIQVDYVYSELPSVRLPLKETTLVADRDGLIRCLTGDQTYWVIMGVLDTNAAPRAFRFHYWAAHTEANVFDTFKHSYVKAGNDIVRLSNDVGDSGELIADSIKTGIVSSAPNGKWYCWANTADNTSGVHPWQPIPLNTVISYGVHASNYAELQNLSQGDSTHDNERFKVSRLNEITVHSMVSHTIRIDYAKKYTVPSLNDNTGHNWTGPVTPTGYRPFRLLGDGTYNPVLQAKVNGPFGHDSRILISAPLGLGYRIKKISITGRS